MRKRNQQSCPRGNRSFLPRVCAGLLALAAAVAMSGCANFHMWGQKSSGSPGSMGGAFNIPLGK